MPYVFKLLFDNTVKTNDVCNLQIPAIHAAVDTLDESAYRAPRDAPLLQLVLNVRGAASLPMRRAQTRQGQGPRVSLRNAPFRLLPSTMGNLDLAVLRPENQRPTHVTPRIAVLAAGLFREQLVVLGRRPSAVTRRSGRGVGWEREGRAEQLVARDRDGAVSGGYAEHRGAYAVAIASATTVHGTCGAGTYSWASSEDIF